MVVNDGSIFQGASTVEKGFTPAKVLLAFASNDAINFPLTGFTGLTLNSVPITLDLGYTNSGGTYTAAMSEPVSFAVTLESNTYTSNKTAALTFNHRLWHFKSATTSSMTEAEVEGYAGYLDNNRQGDRAFSVSGSPEYLWIVYPVSYGAASSFVNIANNFPVPFEAPETLSITNAFGFVANYYCYRSTNPSAGSVTLRVS